MVLGARNGNLKPVGDLFVRQADAKKPENFLLARGKVGRRPALPHFVTLSCHARTSDALVSSCVKLTGVRLPAPSRYDVVPYPPDAVVYITASTKLTRLCGQRRSRPPSAHDEKTGRSG